MVYIFFFFLFCLANAQNQSAIYLPTLKRAPYVGVRTMALVDKTRLDPFANNTQHRELMLSLYYPTDEDPSKLLLNQQPECRADSAFMRYMPNATAAYLDTYVAPFGIPNGTFERLFTRCQPNAPISTREPKFPLIIFSPGMGNSRLQYTTIVQEIARNGYIVASIDHPYDAAIVEFPDGKIITAINIADNDTAGIAALVTVRAKDVSFVLDELSHPSPNHPFHISTTHVPMFGHSLGGATAASVMLIDPRVTGGMNFDGMFLGPITTPHTTISNPFFLFQAARNVTRPDWDDLWNKHLTGWKLELELAGAVHGTFEDFPLLAEVIGVRAGLGERGEQVLGKVGGLRGLEIMTAYVSAFADFVLGREERRLIDGKKSGKFPEVGVVRFSG